MEYGFSFAALSSRREKQKEEKMDNPFSLKKVAIVILGNAIYGFGVVAFVIPNGLITGGSTGLALFFQYQLHIPIEWFVGAFNVVMFILGALVLGKAFALTTLVSTFAYPVILSFYQQFTFWDHLTNNPMLGAIYAGGLIGLGIGIVLRQGASTGGMDIPPLVLNKKFGLSISVMLYLFDSGILLLQVFISSSEQVLYGILVVMIYTFVLDRVLTAGKAQTQIKIVSAEHEKIREMILHTMDRGATLFHAQTGLLRTEQDVVMTVVSNRELPRVAGLVKEIDPHAFIVINQVNEVRGRGFTMERDYRIKQNSASKE